MRIEMAVFAAIALLPAAANAATVFKCVDASGKITFSQQGCPDQPSSAFTVRNQSISGSGPAAVMAQPGGFEVARENEPRRGGVTVVGGNGSSCSDMSSQDIRSAIVRNKVFVGMTAEQAEKSWGKPDKINSSSNGDDQWVYYRADYRSQYIYVDQAGCVTAWN